MSNEKHAAQPARERILDKGGQGVAAGPWHFDHHDGLDESNSYHQQARPKIQNCNAKVLFSQLQNINFNQFQLPINGGV